MLAPTDRFDRLTPALATLLRERLRDLGYVDATLGSTESIAPGMFDVVRAPLVRWHLRRSAAPDALLARLFAYDDAVPAAALRGALGDALTEALVDAGVLRVEGGEALAGFRLLPFEGLYILADDLAHGGDAVMGPGPTTQELARLIPSPSPARVLDVGCGAGTFALLAAARGATGAVGVDINPRAVVLGRANATLNGLDVRFDAGDLFAPVAGSRFDLVVAQPPFVTRPPDLAETVYLHGGPMGDELALRLIAEAPGYLAPLGRALVLTDSAVRKGSPLFARVRHALGAAPVDVLLLTTRGNSPDATAVAYSAAQHPALGDDYVDALERYRSHLDAMGVSEFTHALVTLFAPPEGAKGPPRFTLAFPVKSLRQVDAEALDDLIRSIELTMLPDAALLDASVRVADGARFVDERRSPDRNVEPSVTARLDRGAGTDQQIGEATLALLAAIDGSSTVREASAQYAELVGAPPPAVEPKVLEFVRQYLARGLLASG